MKTEIIRVGCNFFIAPTLEGISNKAAREICENPRKFYGFTNIPNAPQSIAGYYNLHKQKPTNVLSSGSIDTITNFLKDLFKDEYDKALCYLYILAWDCERKLPVLNLHSNDLTTGKTTFLEFVKLLDFENSCSILSIDLLCSFNHYWVAKNIICIDDCNENTHDIFHLIKTAKTICRNQLNCQMQEIPFHGSFIISTRKPIENERIFWNVHLNKIESPDPDLLEKMKAEIPAFMGKLLMSTSLVYKAINQKSYNL